VEIHVFDDQKDLPIKSEQVSELAREVILFEGQTCDEASIHLIDTRVMCEMHGLYFNDPTTTDCISFPLNGNAKDPYKILGDVFVCPQTAQDYVAIHLGEVYEEITLYIIHGLLHLMGYDDIEDGDEKEMREAELRHMKNIKAKGLLLKA
jgi:probable rRNA maturation factor